MRILMTTDAIGGVWTFTRELSHELLARDCAIALVSLGPPPTRAQNEWVAAQSRRWGDRFVFRASDAPLEWMSANHHAYTAGAKELLALIKSFRPDVLISSQYCFGALPVDIPRIVIAHSDVLSWAKACRPEGLQPSAWLEQYCSIVSTGIRRADAVVAPTQWMIDALRSGFELPVQRYVIPHGCAIPPSRLEPLRKMQAVTAGRLWDEAKNLRILEEVDTGISLLVAGAVECEASRYGQSTRLRFCGNLESPELLRLFRQSAIYICTSIYEPFGFAPIEAALCGCIVVAKDIPSLREVWGQSAVFYEDAASLSIVLAMLRENSRFRSRARQRSLFRALQFTPQRMAGMYIDLLRRLVPSSESSSYAV